MITYHNGITQPSHKECNSGFYLIHDPKVLETVKDAASEETERWIRNAVTRAFELLRQAVDPGGSSS
jgi:hypothetical protein